MNYKVYKIGEICSLVKGTYPTLKTEPGRYPLVVTAEYRRTSSTYQIDGAAVCVPLVSSTGHGDAALHRVHYQEGKFAVANLLVALLPKDPNVCSTKYLYHLLMRKKDEYFMPLMRGTSNVSLKEKDIAEVEIALPPLEEQWRIMALIEKLVGKVEEARGLRSKVNEECDFLCRSIIFANSASESVLVPMSELIRRREADVAVELNETYHFAGVYSFGRGVFSGNRLSGISFSYKLLTRLQAGNFVYPKLMAWEGALGVVPPECDGLVVSPEFPVFEVDESRVLPEVLDVYFRTPSVWSALGSLSTGTNVRRRRVNPSNFLKFKMPLPSMETQQRLRAVKKRVDSIQQLHIETGAELNALLPSILDKAFKGEL